MAAKQTARRIKDDLLPRLLLSWQQPSTPSVFLFFHSFIRDAGIGDGIVRARRSVQRRLDSSAQVSEGGGGGGVIDVQS